MNEIDALLRADADDWRTQHDTPPAPDLNTLIARGGVTPLIRSKISVAAAVVMICILATGLGLVTHRSRSHPTTPLKPAVSIYHGPTITYAGVGAIVSAAPRNADPAIDADQARSLFAREGTTALVSGGARPSLQLVEYENAFTETGPQGTQVPEVPKQLAWLATYTYLTEQGLGGAGKGLSAQGTASAPPRHLMTCHGYTAISATTGASLDAFSYCGP